jgi:hypothetical protein
MAEPESAFELRQFLLGLAHNLIHQQAHLDAQYVAWLHAYLPVVRAARAVGHEQLARELAPTPLVIDRAELSAEVQVSRSEKQEFSLNVRLLNIGFMRRHQYAGFVRHTLELSVQRVPFPPGPPRPELNPASPPNKEQ